MAIHGHQPYSPPFDEESPDSWISKHWLRGLPSTGVLPRYPRKICYIYHCKYRFSMDTTWMKKTQSFFFSWCLVWSILCVVKPKHSIHFPWYLNIHALVCDFWPWMVEKLTFLLMMFGLNIAWYAKISEFSTIYVHVQYISLYCLWPLTLESWWGCVSLRVRPSRRGSERQTLTLRFPFCGPL